jgi:hypothetical protein
MIRFIVAVAVLIGGLLYAPYRIQRGYRRRQWFIVGFYSLVLVVWMAMAAVMIGEAAGLFPCDWVACL